MFTEMSIAEFDKAFPFALDAQLNADLLAEVRQDPRYLVRFGTDKFGRFGLEFGYADDHWHMFK